MNVLEKICKNLGNTESQNHTHKAKSTKENPEFKTDKTFYYI